MLRTACSRLGISLLHARPYDPQARGKMERFWRTLREGCLDYLGEVSSLEEVNQRLSAFLARHYHTAPHAGLMGRDPPTVYTPSTRTPNTITEDKLREALAVRERRRVRRDTTVSVAGRIYELSHGFLAGRVVDVVYSHLDEPICPEVEHEGRRFAMHLVDPQKNADGRRKRLTTADTTRTVSFDPSLTTQPESDEPADAEDDDALF